MMDIDNQDMPILGKLEQLCSQQRCPGQVKGRKRLFFSIFSRQCFVVCFSAQIHFLYDKGHIVMDFLAGFSVNHNKGSP